MVAESGKMYWSILEEITKKKNWYNKVFSDLLIKKWHKELTADKGNRFTSDDFWLCIRILRATAQGCFYDPDCDWESFTKLCDSCFDKRKKDLLKNKDFVENLNRYLGEGETEEDIVDDFVNEDINEDFDLERCIHLACGCKSPDSELKDYINYIKEGLLPEDITEKLRNMVDVMRKEDPVDWHPWSNEQVRDIIHPSLYCYVKGVSARRGGIVEDSSQESSKYQWLPSDFSIDRLGNVKFNSYINNLHREEYIPLFEKVLFYFIPSFEKVLNKPLRERECQVIVKVGSIHLDQSRSSYAGGVWHIEGMPYEHIVATGLYYLEAENITPSFLEFRKPTIINDSYPYLKYEQDDSDYTTFHYGIAEHQGNMNRYLGLIKAVPGASVVFPNTLQHHVKEFELDDKTKPGVRTIIAFFLIDPNHRIISTADVPKQYNIMSLDQAKEFRENLMFQRKYFVDEMNKEVYEREFSLCEH